MRLTAGLSSRKRIKQKMDDMLHSRLPRSESAEIRFKRKPHSHTHTRIFGSYSKGRLKTHLHTWHHHHLHLSKGQAELFADSDPKVFLYFTLKDLQTYEFYFCYKSQSEYCLGFCNFFGSDLIKVQQSAIFGVFSLFECWVDWVVFCKKRSRKWL